MTIEQAHEAPKEGHPESPSVPAVAPSSAPAVSSGLAALILEDNLSKGKEIEIPSLGIVLTPGTNETAPISDSPSAGQMSHESSGATEMAGAPTNRSVADEGR